MWSTMFIDIFRMLYQGDRSGQGEVYHSLVAYFQKDKEGAINSRLVSQAGESIPPPVVAMYRKTCKMLIPPARFKGWKGKR